jgi:DHA2 family multidrug resistance protein
LTALGVSDLPADKVASGSGLQNFLRVLSMAVGSSLTQTYWEHAARANRAELVAAIEPSVTYDVVPEAVQAGIPSGSAPALFSRMVDAQAAMLATNDFYAWATVLMVGSIGVVWLVKRPKGPLSTTAH